jgi:putative salt-induced outer membrane protein
MTEPPRNILRRAALANHISIAIRLGCGAAALALVAFPRAASADDDLPTGTTNQKPASSGTTDLTTRSFESAGKKSDDKDATQLTLSAGGLASSGNSRLVALTTSGKFRLRRADDQISAAAAGNYTRTAVPGGPMTTSVENVQGKTRYDRFFDDITAFLGVQARRDRFQGLDLRLNVAPGIGYYFVNEAKLAVWVEGGYDFLYDIRRDDARPVLDDNKNPVLDASGRPVLLAKTNVVHSGRLFFGYLDSVNEAVTLSVGVEYLQGLSDTGVRRVNGDFSVASKIGKGFSLATTIAVRFDNQPLPGKEQLDTTESVSLVYDIF